MPSISESGGRQIRAALSEIFRLLGLHGMRMALPMRVQALVARQQDAAEVFIGLVQVAAIASFAAFYAISRVTTPPPMMVEPVPVALGLYAAITVVRLRLALRRRLTPPLLAASVLVDVFVLMTTVWSFHLQYGAPVALSLKAPTVMYALVLVALRALRFEARYVLLTGAAALAGWGLLVAAALLDGEETTHSFLDYATSTAILPGAEFDKVVSIATVTLILALVVARGRTLLVSAATEQLASAELSRFFAPEVANRIRGAAEENAAGMAERREASILFTDLRGFTRLAHELPPGPLLRLLSAYQEVVVRAVDRHGGSIDKYLGDGVLASFGAVEASPTHAADALRAVEDIQTALRGWQPPESGMPGISVGAAVACGEVLFGTVGARGRLEYTVIGDPVNLAAKLEKHNKVERTDALTHAGAFALATAQGYRPRGIAEVRSRRAVAGVDNPVDLVALRAA